MTIKEYKSVNVDEKKKKGKQEESILCTNVKEVIAVFLWFTCLLFESTSFDVGTYLLILF